MNLHLGQKYFDGKISHGFIALYISKSITRIASGLFVIFLPIFLYELFDKNFNYVIYYYLIGFFLYMIFVPLGVMFLNNFGFKKALKVSIFFGSLFYLLLFFVNQENFKYVIPLAIVVLLAFRILHWVPYHVDFAKFSDRKNRGREVGLLSATTNIIGVAAPVVAGFIIFQFGFGALFILAIIIFTIAIVPLLTIPRTRENFNWSYIESWKEFVSKKRRGVVCSFMADGAENVVGIVIWPIFIFEVLNGNYFQVGLISTLIVGVVVLLQLMMGKILDKGFKKEKLIKFGSIFYSVGWIFKIFIVTAFHIFIIDAYHKLMKVFLRIPYDALTYEIAADQGHYVDEFTVIHEMAIQLGKVLILLIIVGLISFVPISWTFALAAVASIILNLLRSKHPVPVR